MIKPSPTRYDHSMSNLSLPSRVSICTILPGVFIFIFQPFRRGQSQSSVHTHIYISMEMEMEMDSSGSPVPMAYLAATMNETSSCLSLDCFSFDPYTSPPLQNPWHCTAVPRHGMEHAQCGQYCMSYIVPAGSRRNLTARFSLFFCYSTAVRRAAVLDVGQILSQGCSV